MYYQFKRYGDLAEGVYFAFWWRCIDKGLHWQTAQQACSLIYQLDLTLVTFFLPKMVTFLMVRESVVGRKRGVDRTQ